MEVLLNAEWSNGKQANMEIRVVQVNKLGHINRRNKMPFHGFRLKNLSIFL